jgi:hypothetical protein
MKLPDRTQKLLLVIYGLGIFILSLYHLFFFFRQGSHLIYEDAMYYMAIADSVHQSGELLNRAVEPAAPVKTPQNGIVLVYVALSAAGLSPESRLVAIVITNYLLHLSAIYPLYKIARRVGLQGTWPMAALLGIYVGAYQFYRAQLIPINDGIFNALSIWLVYLIILLYDGEAEKWPRNRRWWAKLAIAVVLAAALIHFRVQMLPILGAAFLAALLARRYRAAVWTAGLTGGALASLSLFYLFWANAEGVSQTGSRRLATISGNTLWHTISGWVAQAIPELLFIDRGLPFNLIYLPFALVLSWALFIGLRRRDVRLLFISLLCVMSILFLTLVTVTSGDKFVQRYIIYIIPFLYLLILLPVRIRPVGYLFVTLMLLYALAKVRFAFDVPQPTHSQYWLYLHEQRVTLPAEAPLLISEEASSTYFLFGIGASRETLTWDAIMQHRRVYLVGSDKLVSPALTTVEQLAKANGYTFKQRNLTPDYQNEAGYALLELYDFTPEQVATQPVGEPTVTNSD